MCNRIEYTQYFEVATFMLEKVLSFFNHHRRDPSWSLAHSYICTEMLYHKLRKELKQGVLLIHPVLVLFKACQAAEFNASIKKIQIGNSASENKTVIN